MSVALMNDIWKSRNLGITLTEKAILIRLAFFANEKGGNIRPGLALIAGDCECSRSTAVRLVKGLVQKEVLILVIEHSVTKNEPNEYRLNLDKIKRSVKNPHKKEQRLTDLSTGDPVLNMIPPPVPVVGTVISNISEIHPVPILVQTCTYPRNKPVPRIGHNRQTYSLIDNDRQEIAEFAPVDNSNTPSKTPSEKTSKKLSKGCRLDPDVVLTGDWILVACEAGLHPSQFDKVFIQFVNYWVAIPGQKGIKVDWKRTWQNWCIRALEWNTKLKRSRDEIGNNASDAVDWLKQSIAEDIKKLNGGAL